MTHCYFLNLTKETPEFTGIYIALLINMSMGKIWGLMLSQLPSQQSIQRQLLFLGIILVIALRVSHGAKIMSCYCPDPMVGFC